MTNPEPPRLLVRNAIDTGLPVLEWHRKDGTVEGLELNVPAALALMEGLLQAIRTAEAHAGLVAEIDTLGA